MASLTRSLGALRGRAPRVLAQRCYADAPSKTETTTTDAAPSSDASSSSSSSPDASASSSSTTPSSAVPSAEEVVEAVQTAVPLSSKFPQGKNVFGATKSYKQSKPEFEVEENLPLSAKILPIHASPMPPWHTGPQQIWTINYPRPTFPTVREEDYPNVIGGDTEKQRLRALSAISGLTQSELKGLRRCTIEMKYVVNMTTKGKMRSVLSYVLVGDAKKGLLGLGRGRGNIPQTAVEAAFYDAVLNMDSVDKYEGRTLWGQGKELETKFASTKVCLRARPPGHGLQVPGSVHRVLAACGIRDASASIHGSTHKVNVTKAVIQLLHGGANPPGFGDGAGGHAKRDNRGSAMRSRDEIQRARGRYGVDVGLLG